MQSMVDGTMDERSAVKHAAARTAGIARRGERWRRGAVILFTALWLAVGSALGEEKKPALPTKVTGVVLDADGQPFPQANVVVIGKSNAWTSRAQVEAITLTDDGGEFALPVNGSTFSNVWAYMPGVGISQGVYLSRV